jgi:hypothetical protein
MKLTVNSTSLAKIIAMPIFLLFAIFILTIQSALADKWDPTPNPAELPSLPTYCQAKWDKTQFKDHASWAQSMGEPTWRSLHHYCYALNWINRYNRCRGNDCGYLHHLALNDFGYVLKNPSTESWITPEMYVNRGMAFKMVHRNNEALKDFYRAIQLNPKYSKAYHEIATYFTGLKQNEKALEIVKKGLAQSPQDKSLLKLYQRLDGNLSDLPPFQAATDVTQGKTKESNQSTVPATLLPNAKEETTNKSALNNEVSNGSVNPVQTKPSPAGVTKNPYCRFCPE